MCGLTGWVGDPPGTREDGARLLRAMTDTLAHRGPDDSGCELLEGAALGHRRLSIIDLTAGGHQPMWSADRRYVIAYNGEVYNFPELRAGLERDGQRFATRSDTEVLLALYATRGEAMLGALNGMFAFAIWDTVTHELFAARDRLGKKPFYYADLPGAFVFGSELKALLRHPRVSRDLDRGAIVRYLAHEYVPDPRSAFRDVRKLPGGHALRVAGGRVRTWRWWQCPFRGPAAEVPEREAVARVRELLQDAVAKRLVSDVPIGVFLSGGIDSSSVVAMMSRIMPARDIKTFSIGFREAPYDESAYARTVAGHFGTTHHEDILHAARMLEILPEIVERLDEPFADASIVPTYLLCGLVRRHVTVALGGDGGDELFAGYPLFPRERPARWLAAIASPAARARLDAASRRLPAAFLGSRAGHKLRRFLCAAPWSEAVRHHVWMSAFYPDMQDDLWDGPVDEDVRAAWADLEALAAESGDPDPQQRSAWVYYRTYLQEDILAKVDRASMMHSLEVRAPFLDVRLVEYVSALPAHLKLRGDVTKYLLKEAMRADLPPGLADRRKKGFGVPLGQWLRGELANEVRAVLAPERIRAGGLFRPATVTRMVEDHLARRRDWRKPLWALFLFEKWRQHWVAGA